MAFKCHVCGKGPVSGKSVSHSHRATNRYFLPNLQKVKILVGSTPKRVYVCTTCLKSNRVKKA